MMTLTQPTKIKSFAERSHDYCKQVVSGEQIASEWIRLACQQHLDDLKKTDSRWHFDSDNANRACAFIETHNLDNGQRFRLQAFQVWLVTSLVAWVDEAGTRKHIEALIIIAKGNGKSPLAAALALWFAFFDGARNSEVYCGATSLAQAMEVFRPALNFIESRKDAYKKLGITAQKKSIFSRSGAKFQPIIGKGKHGPRPRLAILDELHQAISSDLYETLKTGCNKTKNSLLLTISTAGISSTESTCYQLQIRAQKALDGSEPDERLFAAIYAPDEEVQWNSEQALLMANPNLGISNDAEKIRLAIAEASRNPAHANNIKAMHLNIWSGADSSWLDRQAVLGCFDPELNEEFVKDLPCIIGFDLSNKIDLTAAVKLFYKDIDGKRHYYAICRTYLPQARIDLPESTHYRKWLAEGWLTATDGNEIDFSLIESDALADIGKFHVEAIRPDDKYAVQLMQRIETTTGVTRIDSITPPEYSPAMKELEAAIDAGRFHHDGNSALVYCLGNITTYVRRDDAYAMPSKDRDDNKIDVGIALLIAATIALRGTVETAQPSIDFW